MRTGPKSLARGEGKKDSDKLYEQTLSFQMTEFHLELPLLSFLTVVVIKGLAATAIHDTRNLFLQLRTMQTQCLPG